MSAVPVLSSSETSALKAVTAHIKSHPSNTRRDFQRSRCGYAPTIVISANEDLGGRELPKILTRAVNASTFVDAEVDEGIRSRFWVMRGDVLFAPPGELIQDDNESQESLRHWPFLCLTDMPKTRTNTSFKLLGYWLEFVSRSGDGDMLYCRGEEEVSCAAGMFLRDERGGLLLGRQDNVLVEWDMARSRWTYSVTDALEEVIQQSIADDDGIDRAVGETQEPKRNDDDSDCEDGTQLFLYMIVMLTLLQLNRHRKKMTGSTNAVARE
jgi:hypothetical protein